MTILSIHLHYYKKIREQVERILGKTSKELKNYTKRYEDELKRATSKKVSSETFFKSVNQADVLLVGDFHAQPQSARALLRICRKLGATRVVLALECFKSSDQKHINKFLAGELNEQDFLSTIEWRKYWGFPWEPTRALMKWALQNQVPVYGINLGGPQKSLKRRDQHFSQVLNQIQMKNKNKVVVTQVGDFHLAQKHLPLELKKLNKKLKTQSVYQSPDALYFNLKAKTRSSDFLDLGSQRWALMTVVPWVKWQDYLLYLESGLDKSIYSEDELDITDHVDRFMKLMSHSLQIKIDNQNLSVYLAHDPQVSKSLKKLESPFRKKIKHDLSCGSSIYIPELEIGVVGRLTVNHISRVAAQFILFKIGVYPKTLLDTQANFLKMIWLEMLTYFMSKLANPKRKTDTLSDIRNALNHAAYEDNGRQALALALEQKMREIQFVNTGNLSQQKARRSQLMHFSTASEILGGVLGEKTFHAFQKKAIRFPEGRGFLFKNLQQKNFEASYYDAIEVIDSWPLPFKSKYDQF